MPALDRTSGWPRSARSSGLRASPQPGLKRSLLATRPILRMLSTRQLVASTSFLRPATSCRSFGHAAPPVELPTIFAPATGRTRSAISIMRISGPASLQIYHKLTAPPKSRLTGLTANDRGGKRAVRNPEPRKALLRRIIHPQTGEVLDEGLVLYFPSKPKLS